MRHAIIILLLLLPTFSIAAKPTPTIEVCNIAGDWLTFWDAIKGQPTAERVAVLKRDVAVKFPDFCGIARIGDEVTQEKRDARIARAML